jgi:TetR/AcrR family transcriptional repressor of mexJK operon
MGNRTALSRVATPGNEVATAALVPAPRLRRGRPTLEQSGKLRDNILDAALQSFVSRGFSASGMEGIAREAQVSRMTLYRHFETKEALFIQVVRRAQLSVRSRLGNIPVDRAAPLEAVLREIVEKLYDGYTQPQYLAVMRMVVAEANRFPKLGRVMLDDSSYIAEPLVDYLDRLKLAGKIQVESPYDAATQISGLASGAGRYLLLQPSRHPQSRKHWVDSLVVLFSRAWRAPLTSVAAA